MMCMHVIVSAFNPSHNYYEIKLENFPKWVGNKHELKLANFELL